MRDKGEVASSWIENRYTVERVDHAGVVRDGGVEYTHLHEALDCFYRWVVKQPEDGKPVYPQITIKHKYKSKYGGDAITCIAQCLYWKDE